MKKKALAGVVLAIVSAAASAVPGTTTDFSKGNGGWSVGPAYDGSEGSWIDTSLGNGAPALHTRYIETFGLNWLNSTGAVKGDYGKLGSVTLGLDMLTNSIQVRGQDVTRNLIVELRDYDNPAGDMPFTSVWYNLGEIGTVKGEWQHFSVTIGDTGAIALPSGWGGYGDGWNNPSLPPGRTFADVLASVDEIAFTTFTPGYSYGWTAYDVAVDNISVSAVPEPTSIAMMAGGLGLLGLIRRRRGSSKRIDKA